MMGKFDLMLTNMKDYHIPFAAVVFGTGTCLQWFHHLDGMYLSFTSTVLTFIATHKWLDNQDTNPGRGN